MSEIRGWIAGAAGPLALLEAGLPVVVRLLPRSNEQKKSPMQDHPKRQGAGGTYAKEQVL